LVYDISFTSARSYHDQNIILTHLQSLIPSWAWNAFKVFENARFIERSMQLAHKSGPGGSVGLICPQGIDPYSSCSTIDRSVMC
jgi:hypothetical protein